MKKNIIIALFLLGSTKIFAYLDVNPKQIKLENKTSSSIPSSHKRTPALIPTAYIDGHTLTFDSSCNGCPITVLEDDIVVFCGTIDEEGTLILPDCLEGTFTIELQRGSITFVGEVEVE